MQSVRSGRVKARANMQSLAGGHRKVQVSHSEGHGGDWLALELGCAVMSAELMSAIFRSGLQHSIEGTAATQHADAARADLASPLPDGPQHHERVPACAMPLRPRDGDGDGGIPPQDDAAALLPLVGAPGCAQAAAALRLDQGVGPQAAGRVGGGRLPAVQHVGAAAAGEAVHARADGGHQGGRGGHRRPRPRDAERAADGPLADAVRGRPG